MAAADQNVVRRQTASLLNAAGWKMSSVGAISHLTPSLLTATDCNFVAGVDEGKRIAIDLGDTLGIFVSTILTVNSATSVTMSTTPGIGGSDITGASVSYGGRMDDDRHNLLELREAIYEADDEIYEALATTPEHWIRSQIETPVAVTHGTQLPNHFGAITSVMIKIYPADVSSVRGKRTDYESIQRYRNNTGVAPFDTYGQHVHTDQNSPIGGYFHIDGASMIFFSGTSATALMVLYTDPRTSLALNTPAAFTGLIVFNAAVRMYKQGAIDAYFDKYNAISMRGMAGIKANSREIPDPGSVEQPMQQAA